MSKPWTYAKLGEIADVQSGGTPAISNKTFWDGVIPWYSSGELNEVITVAPERRITEAGLIGSNAKLFPAGSLLIGMYDTAALKMSILDRNAAFNQAIAGVKPNGSVNIRFVFYALNAIKEELLSRRRGVRQKNLSLGKVRDFPVPVLPMGEQERIVAILDEAFEAIAKAKANAEKNLQNATELFKTYLGATFAQQGEVLPLSECATDISDGDHAPPPKSPEGVPFITISNVNKETRHIDFSDTFTVSRGYFDALKPHRKPRCGDVLYTVTGSFGIPVLVEDDREFCFQRHIGLIRPKPDVSSRWLMYALLSPQVRAQAEAGATGTAQRTVSLGTLRAITIPKVSFEEQCHIATKVDALYCEIGRLKDIWQAKIATLDELRKTLLQQAFSGQLTASKPLRVVQPQSLQTASPQFAANVIAIAYVRHETQKREKTFGRVKEQKVLHLVEAIAKVDLGRQPMKDAAGPNDFQHMLRAEQWAKQHSFFEMVDRGQGYDFKPLKDFDKHLLNARQELGPHLSRIEEVIDLLVPMDSQDAEVFATVHAAWNNLLMDGVEATDAAILKEARDTWHPDKLSIPEHKFKKAIELVRRKNLIPDGTGKYVTGQRALL